MGQLHLRLEVADRAEPADDEVRVARMAEVDREPVEALDDDPLAAQADTVECVTDRRHAFGRREQRRLPWVRKDGDDHPIEHHARAPKDVEVTVGDGVERAGIDRDAHRSSSSEPAR